MFHHHVYPSAVRGLVVTVFMALLAGCIPHSNPAAPVPANLTATAGDSVVTVSWAPSTGASGYNVKRSTKSGGPYTTLGSTPSPTYTDSAVTNGVTYYYVASALNPAGESVNSGEVAATPSAPKIPPAVPVDVVAVAGNAVVTLNWTASTAATAYYVKRATVSGGPYTQIAAPVTPGYTDLSVLNGTMYFYVVSAVDAGGESANSAEASATPSVPSAPAAPTNVTATAGNAQASLAWSASIGALSYHVKRSTTSGGPYTQIAAPTTTAYTDASLTNGTTYFYVVSAVNTLGESPNSAQVSALPTNPPPTNFGTWTNVTPAGIDLTSSLCGNGGTQSVQPDLTHPSNLYVEFNCQGIWKSTDYGATWTGPINTGTNAALVSDCNGGITVLPSGTASAPTIYQSCIRGNGIGFWKSVDGGVNWTQYTVAPGGIRQDYYQPVVDPYDANHLVMAAHETDSLVESVDGGQNWTAIPLNSGMLQNGRTGFIFFIDTGVAATTRGTWLWMGEQTGGTIGTWRTASSGASWTPVDKNEHPLGSAQIYQPDTSGVLYMAGAYSELGWGVLRSEDFGQTWSHVGLTNNETVVIGTSKDVYSMFGIPVGPGGTTDPSFEVASQPGNGAWVAPGTPAGLTQGSAQLATVNDGTHNVLLGAMWNSGLWRYVEP